MVLHSALGDWKFIDEVGIIETEADGDVTWVLCELELLIEKVKVSTTPDGKVMDLFFIVDTRELMHTAKRQRDTCDHLKHVLGDAVISCEIEMIDAEVMLCSQASSLPSEIVEESCSLELNEKSPSRSLASKDVSVTLDNSLSPSHTLVQIVCQDHKGLIYDIMRTLKDYNIQISYGRFSKKQKKICEIDLFIMQADGKKILDQSKQNALSTRLQIELIRPLRVAVLSRGPDTELLVANPTELSGKGRPLVFYDITLALKLLDIGYPYMAKLNYKDVVYQAEIRRHLIGDREWEVYRVMLDEGAGSSVSRSKIEEGVRKMLMGWA
ncbi:ACT domain-containing protein ACR10 isoform X1 [Cucumis melo var. makuwa]|uniref:ACT domain-containing protein ACR n=1 Tax=Cucumis melo var. makuwa TaxID=1194695 RepID=A0A5D3DNG6_CUCMM|nr:ACT domain-containing protein ACR10 isoform X1 [Cucumis melo var. makuwa]